MGRTSVFLLVIITSIWLGSASSAKEVSNSDDAPARSPKSIKDSISRFLGIDASSQDFLLVEDDGPVKFLTVATDVFLEAIGAQAFAYLMPPVAHFRAEPENDGWEITSIAAAGYANHSADSQAKVKTTVGAENFNAKLAYELAGESRATVELDHVNSATSIGGDSNVRSFATIYLWSRLKDASAPVARLDGGLAFSDMRLENWRSGVLSLQTVGSTSINWSLKGDVSDVRKDVVAGYSLRDALRKNLGDGQGILFSPTSEYELTLKSKNIVNKPELNLRFGIDEVSWTIRNGERPGILDLDGVVSNFRGLNGYFSSALGQLLPFDAKVNGQLKFEPVPQSLGGKSTAGVSPIELSRFSASIDGKQYNVEVEGSGSFAADTHKFNGRLDIQAKGLKTVVEKTVLPNLQKYRLLEADGASLMALFALGKTSDDVTSWTIAFKDGAAVGP